MSSNTFNRIPIADKIHFSTIADSKFKDNRLSVNFIMPLQKETASVNAIVPLILRKGCAVCPDFSSLNAQLDELYGAQLDAEVTKYGGYQVLEVSIQALDDRFALNGEGITKECAKLLCEIVLNPKINSAGEFDQSDVALEKQYLLDTIESEINDKRTYALAQCITKMCGDEPVSVRRFGNTASAEKITAKSAVDAYKNIVKTAMIEIVFSGAGNSLDALDIFKASFANTARKPIDYAPISLKTSADKVREHVENMELSQSKLVLGLRTGEIDTPEKITAARVFSGIFGGTPFSKLFLNVRERLSLCYYCASRFDVATKLLLVDSGVQADNKQKAQDEILAQLQSIVNGDFDDEQLVNTKLLMKNSITATNDSLSSLEGWYLTQILRGQSFSPEQDVALLNAVTKEQIMAVAAGITLDTIYFLTGDGDEKGEE